ncbi:MAG: HDOD domain-containing protein [Halioglobus sp.]
MEKTPNDSSPTQPHAPQDPAAQAVAHARIAAAREATRKFVEQLAMDLAEGDFDLPPFPDTAVKVQQCIRDPNADNQTLAAIIATEPALAARLMRMANSVAMRRGPIEVTDIPTAISRVGLDMVQNVAAAFAAREAFRATPGSPCIDELIKLRRQGVRVAAIAYLLARQLRGNYKPDEAMLAGLLSAVGKFCIFTKAADYPELFTDRKSLDQLVAQWHTGVARAIVESWGFPDTVAIAVDEQEVRVRERSDSADLSDLLFVANLLARAGVRVAEHLGDLDALARLRIDAGKLHALLSEGEEEIQSMASAMA